MAQRDEIRVVRGAIGEGLELSERTAELDSLTVNLEAASEGSGRLIVIEGPAGIGKSSLLAAAAARARATGFRAVTAAGSEIEHDYPFGVAIQLFEPVWSNAEPDDRAALELGPAHLAASLFEGKLPNDPSASGAAEYPLIRALYSLARNLVAPRSKPSHAEPLAVLVDDAHWADRSSLRLLAYLAARMSDLPIALIATLRPAEGIDDRAALMSLQRIPRAVTLRPEPLSTSAVTELILAELPDVDADFVSTAYEQAHGNPFLLTELLAHAHSTREGVDAPPASLLSDRAPNGVVEAAAARLEALSHEERNLTCAAAVLGDSVELKVAARVAELDLHSAATAADSLAEMHVLAPGSPLAFRYPVVRSAVLMSISPLLRGEIHRRAALVLRQEGAPADVVARHLLASPAGSDPVAAEALREAAQAQLKDGHAETAARQLSRALDEQPSPQLYPDLVAELGQAEARAGSQRASERLAEAIRVNDDPRRRAELALERGRLLVAKAGYAEAAEIFDEGRRDLGRADPELERELEAAYISAASLVPSLVPDAIARRDAMLEQPADQHQRTAVAQTLILDSLRGAPRKQIRRLARLAWDDGLLLDSTANTSDLRLASLIGALLFVDELERAIELGETVLTRRVEQDHNDVLPSCVTYLCAWPRLERGEIDQAAGDAEAALDAPDRLYWSGIPAYGTLAATHLLRGQLDHAELALAMIGDESIRATLSHPFLLEMRARLRLAQRRPSEALADALEAGKCLVKDFEVTNPGAVPWRSTAAMAELALQNPGRAEELAAEELDAAQKIGVTRVVVRDLRVLASITGGKTGIELLEQAVATAEGSPPRLETILAHLDLGSALRRAKKRAAARAPLRNALELANRGGATVIEERARMELAAAGSRPRRRMLSGVESLTPGELRVARLASRDLTTRMIADELFITPKTVEFHLRNIYQKLDVNSRSQLATVMSKRAAG